jgi:hypothetical protein
MLVVVAAEFCHRAATHQSHTLQGFQSRSPFAKSLHCFVRNVTSSSRCLDDNHLSLTLSGPTSMCTVTEASSQKLSTSNRIYV